MKSMLTGEILGICFAVGVAYYLLNDTGASLLQMAKVMLLLYIPQRICLFLQCKYLMAGVIKKMEDEKSG